MLEHKTIMGISPHITDLENKGINRSAQPGDSFFSTPEGMALSYPIHTLATYIDTSDSDRPSLLRKVAKELVSHPEQIGYFWNQTTTVDRMKSRGEHLKSALSPVLKEAASEIDTFSLTETQLLSVFKALYPPSTGDKLEQEAAIEPAGSIWSGLIRGTVHKSLWGLPPEEIKERVKNGKIRMNELQYTQDRIVHLLYTLTTAVMETHDKHLLTKLFELSTFQTPYLDKKKVQSGLFVSAVQSLNNQTFAKYTLVDHARVLLGNMFNIDTGGVVVHSMEKALELSPVGMQYIIEAQAQKNKSRADLLLEFYQNRCASLGQTFLMKTVSIGEYYTRPFPFPENILYTNQQKLWYQYLGYLSTYNLEKGLVSSPILPLSLPDGTVRFIALQEGDNRLAAREVMKYAAENGTPSEITNAHVVDSFLTYSKPSLLETTYAGLEHNNKQKQAALLTQACHGIPKVGVHIAIDQDQHHEIAASMLSFDQSATFINVTIGNYTLKLQLNNEYELCYADGKPLEIDGQTKIWWKHVILPPLAELICKSPEEHEGYIDGTQGLSYEERMAAAKHTILKRIGHIRHLGITPDGKEKHNTQEQRDKVLALDYPLPHTPKLDLYELNKTDPFNEFGNKVTYVLPVERELIETPVFYLPHAYDESQDLLDSDPNR